MLLSFLIVPRPVLAPGHNQISLPKTLRGIKTAFSFGKERYLVFAEILSFSNGEPIPVRYCQGATPHRERTSNQPEVQNWISVPTSLENYYSSPHLHLLLIGPACVVGASLEWVVLPGYNASGPGRNCHPTDILRGEGGRQFTRAFGEISIILHQ